MKIPKNKEIICYTQPIGTGEKKFEEYLKKRKRQIFYNKIIKFLIIWLLFCYIYILILQYFNEFNFISFISGSISMGFYIWLHNKIIG